MKTIYLDNNYMCHLENDGTRTEIQTDVFDSTADGAIPYYRHIPEGATWNNGKGLVIHGLFVQATNSAAIDREILQAMIMDMQNALNILRVSE